MNKCCNNTNCMCCQTGKCCSCCNCGDYTINQVLVGKKAPDFTTSAVLANGEIVDNYNFSSSVKNKYSVVFFYPLDFTFVCPSELIAFDKKIDDFKKHNVEVIGISIDSHYTHSAWRNTPINKGGIGHVNYTLVADINHKICRSYGIEAEGGVAYRGSFLIDRNGIVRHMVVNDLPLGRNIDEMLRMVEALQFTEEHGEVCPANWNKGKQGMKPTTSGVAEYLSKHSKEL